MHTIIYCCLGTIILAISSIIIFAVISGKPVEVTPNKSLSDVDETTCDILFYASLAPNSHNAQMWEIDIYPKSECLYMKLNEQRLLNVVDPENREAYISAGCYLANLETAFDAYGYEYSIDIFEEPDENGYFVKVLYTVPENFVKDENMLSLMLKRHTDKSNYLPSSIPDSDLLTVIENDFAITYHKKGSDNFLYLKQGTIDAVTVQSANQAYRDELAEWMRFSDAEVLEKQDGISAEQIGLKGIVKSFYYWTTTHESAKSDIFASQGIKSAENQVNNCDIFFIITGENTINSWIQVGIKTEKLWLKCVNQGISLQPMSAILETSPFAESIQTDLDLNEPVQMIIRGGLVSDYGKNSNIRLDLSDYVIVK